MFSWLLTQKLEYGGTIVCKIFLVLTSQFNFCSPFFFFYFVQELDLRLDLEYDNLPGLTNAWAVGLQLAFLVTLILAKLEFHLDCMELNLFFKL